MIKRYTLGIPLINVVFAALCRLDIEGVFSRILTPEGAVPAPVGLFSVPLIVLIWGGYTLIGGVCGYRLMKRYLQDWKSISAFAIITFIIIFCITSLQSIGRALWDAELSLISATQQTIGFVIGGMMGRKRGTASSLFKSNAL